jgi:large subunit ribosomal protein L54
MKKAILEEPEAETKEITLNMDVCLGANYFKTGDDPVIKPESEYPDWLWELDKPQEPDESSKQYWRKLRKKRANIKIASLKQL